MNSPEKIPTGIVVCFTPSRASSPMLAAGICPSRMTQFIIQMITRLYKLPPISTKTAEDVPRMR